LLDNNLRECVFILTENSTELEFVALTGDDDGIGGRGEERTSAETAGQEVQNGIVQEGGGECRVG